MGRHLNVNLKGYFLVGQAVARRMVENGTPGAIVQRVVRRAGGGRPEPHPLLRVEGRVEMLTKQMALELAPHRIRVNAIAPV